MSHFYFTKAKFLVLAGSSEMLGNQKKKTLYQNGHGFIVTIVVGRSTFFFSPTPFFFLDFSETGVVVTGELHEGFVLHN